MVREHSLASQTLTRGEDRVWSTALIRRNHSLKPQREDCTRITYCQHYIVQKNNTKVVRVQDSQWQQCLISISGINTLTLTSIAPLIEAYEIAFFNRQEALGRVCSLHNINMEYTWIIHKKRAGQFLGALIRSDDVCRCDVRIR